MDYKTVLLLQNSLDDILMFLRLGKQKKQVFPVARTHCILAIKFAYVAFF